MTMTVNNPEVSAAVEVQTSAFSIEEPTPSAIDLIRQEVELTKEIDSLRQRLTKSREVRRSIPKPTAALEAAQKALQEAQEKVQRLEQEKAEAKALLSTLNTRLDAGDEDVTVDEIVAAEKSIERADRLIKPAKASERKAEQALKPLVADDHLANLAADALEKVTDVPVVICKTVEEAPDFEPLIIVSQTRATEGYGTLDCSGEVRLSRKGVELDLKALRDALSETGSEVSITREGIQFTDARWPVPRLSKPSPGAVQSYMADFGRAWHGLISGRETAERLRAQGYHAAKENGWTGLFMQKSIDLAVEDGKAVGTTTFSVGAQHRAEDLDHDVLRAKLNELVEIFRRESIGGFTHAGEIVNVSLTDTAIGQWNVWSADEVEWHMGRAMYPATLDATLTIEFRYEKAEV